MLKNIIEQFEETEFLKADGFDEAVIGFDFNSERLIYSISKMIEILVNDGMEKIDAIEVTIVLGTWCSDSQREVPRFFKVLNEAGYNDKRVKVIAVDKNKEAVVVNVKI